MIEHAIKAVDHEDRQNLRTLAACSQVPKTTILRHMKEEKTLKARSSRLKPLLSEANKTKRVRFAVGLLQPGLHGTHFFDNMYNRVHVDEKWFYVTQVKRTVYVYDDEELALKAAKSTRFITKVMFLAVVARPRYDAHKKEYFDGKLGIWPFVSHVAAARSSKNRPRGTIESVPKSMDSEAYKDCMLRNVVPAILSKFPRSCLQRGVVIHAR